MSDKCPSPARFTVAVGSGKGGVGKSTVSLNLALALVENGARVGLLDLDFYGPNIPLMVGLKREKWQGDWTMASKRGMGKEAVIVPMERYGLKIMSAGFIIAEDQPMILDAQTAFFLVRQLVKQVAWGELDYLIVDLPPGTADIQQSLSQELPLSGAVVIVTPQDVAHLDGKKAVRMFRRSGVPLLGAVENMAGFVCPHCDKPIDIFAQVPSHRAIWSVEVDRLGGIPFEPMLSQAGDSGRPFLISQPQSPHAAAFREIARRLMEKLHVAAETG
jgi:ATP-binding protein involved in chromosome partitioning